VIIGNIIILIWDMTFGYQQQQSLCRLAVILHLASYLNTWQI